MTVKELDDAILSLKITRSKIKALREDEATYRDKIEEFLINNGINSVTKSDGTLQARMETVTKRNVDIGKLIIEFPAVYAIVGNTITYNRLTIE